MTSAGFTFPSGRKANPELCAGAAVRIPSFRLELLLISLLWQRFPQQNKPQKRQILWHFSFFLSDPQAQTSLNMLVPVERGQLNAEDERQEKKKTLKVSAQRRVHPAVAFKVLKNRFANEVSALFLPFL